MSLPPRERGLKFTTTWRDYQRPWVAPSAGAWIEIKLIEAMKKILERVAPSAGAWIEIQSPPMTGIVNTVAPSAGAWIEI